MLTNQKVMALMSVFPSESIPYQYTIFILTTTALQKCQIIDFDNTKQPFLWRPFLKNEISNSNFEPWIRVQGLFQIFLG